MSALNAMYDNRFALKIGDLLHHDLFRGREEGMVLARHIAHTLADASTKGEQLANGILVETGIQRQWNNVFARYRSSILAEWVRPHVTGEIIDLLCGDGRVGLRIEEAGNPVTYIERGEHASDEIRSHPRFREFNDIDLSSALECDTIILSTVLHHEPEPGRTIEFAMRSARKRIIVIENCIDDEYPFDLQMQVDRFFNRCLNPNAVPFPGTHMTAAGWAAQFQTYGPILKLESSDAIPGIPLRHHLIVVGRP